MIEFTVGLLNKVERDLEEWGKDVENRIKEVSIQAAKTIETIEGEIKLASDQIDLLENDLKMADDVIKANDDAEIKFNKIIAANEKQISAYKSQISSLKSMKSAAEGEDKSKIQSQIDDVSEEMETLKRENTELRGKISKIHDNRPKLEHIKSVSRTKISECKEHRSSLKTYKSRVSDSLNNFKNNVAPYVLKLIYDEILPAMSRTVMCGSELAMAIVELASQSSYYSSNYYSVEVSIDSASWFKSQTNEFRNSVDAINSCMNSGRRITDQFASKLKDKVTVYAKKEMSDTTYEIQKYIDNTLKPIISKMNEVAMCCSAYESITV